MVTIEISIIIHDTFPVEIKALHNLLLKFKVLNLTYMGKPTNGWNLKPQYAQDTRGTVIPK